LFHQHLELQDAEPTAENKFAKKYSSLSGIGLLTQIRFRQKEASHSRAAKNKLERFYDRVQLAKGWK
jgi:hypothetical protein